MVRKSAITRMFAGSPVRPLQEHMEQVCECADKLPDFFNAIIARDADKARTIQKSIAKMEGDADVIKAGLRMNLPNSLFMPMPREQILDIVRLQDKIANISEDVAGTVVGRKMVLPEPVAESFLAFVERAADAANQARTAINELDELVETGFRGREIDLVENMIDKLENIESKVDKLEKKLRSDLYEIEQDYPPLDMMFLYRIISWIGKLADVAHQIGARIQLLMAR